MAIAWTIAGSDSGGAAGLQADLHTFHALGVHGCSVVTAVTAQNSQTVAYAHALEPSLVRAQLDALYEDLKPQAIKLGMLADAGIIRCVADFLEDYDGFVVCDPVLKSTSGQDLLTPDARNALLEILLPHVSLLTPNLPETEWLLNCSIQTDDDIINAARQLRGFGVDSVLIKGGHGTGQLCRDYWADQQYSFWLNNPRLDTPHTRGSGCVTASAIAAAVAQGYEERDAIVIARMYVNQGIRQAHGYGKGAGPVAHHGWPNNQLDLPMLTYAPIPDNLPAPFPDCAPIGLYPVVDNVTWLERLLPLGVKTIQLRIKHTEQRLAAAQRSVELANAHQAKLFINDDWQLAIEVGAYGVHLGQSDLDTADLNAIRAAGLRLGISTHCYYEMARAHAVRPSYIALGPIYHTTTKDVPFPPQGLTTLKYWQDLLDYPLTAIGGIDLENLPDILATGVDGIAVISAITQAAEPETSTSEFLCRIEAYGKKI